jgi:hypothetical protein
MINARLVLAFLAAFPVSLADAATTPATAPLGVAQIFGPRVTENPRFKAPVMIGDFDGDGVPDALYLVTVKPAAANASFAKDVTVVEGLWYSQPLGNRGEKLVPAIVFGKTGKKFLLPGHEEAGTDFFESPIWSADPIPLSVAVKGSRQFKQFAKADKRIKNDVIVIGTEAGDDTALFWTGKKFAWYEPPGD